MPAPQNAAISWNILPENVLDNMAIARLKYSGKMLSFVVGGVKSMCEVP
jgi:hypothetical protein